MILQATMHRDDVCICQAYTCGVPNVVKTVGQIENEMDIHRWHFLGLKTVNLMCTCAQKRLFLHALGHTLKWRQGLMHHGHMHRGKTEVFKCAPTTLSKLFIILSWHSPLIAPGWLTVMQDLAGHKVSANEGVCSIAGSLWIVQSVSCCCLIAAWGPVAKSFLDSLDPIDGLGKLGNISVVSNSNAGRKWWSWGEQVQVHWKQFSFSLQKSEKLCVTAKCSKWKKVKIVKIFVCDRGLIQIIPSHCGGRCAIQSAPWVHQQGLRRALWWKPAAQTSS